MSTFQAGADPREKVALRDLRDDATNYDIHDHVGDHDDDVTGSDGGGGGGEAARRTWSRKAEFMLSMIGEMRMR